MSLSATELAGLVVTAVAVMAVPGPSVLHVVTQAVASGRRDALVAALGVGIGLLVQVVAVAAGLGGLVSRSETAEAVVRGVGATVLIVVGVRAYRARRELAARATAGVGEPRGAVLREAVVVGVLNPKRLLVLVALLPQFTTDGGPPLAVQLLLLGALVATVALVCDLAWGTIAAAAGGRLRARRARLERLGAVAGGLMVLLGLRLALPV